MKAIRYLILIAVFGTACEPDWIEPYENFTIPAGAHSKSFPIEMLQSDVLTFEAIFDESAKYTLASEENQWDTNKLMGFSDCNSQHHSNSARFGWRWVEERLEILAYCYVDGERIIEPLGEIKLNESNRYSLQLKDENYIFKLNDLPKVSISRKPTCDVGFYYMLFPYFGGNEVAPHDIVIKIKRLY